MNALAAALAPHALRAAGDFRPTPEDALPDWAGSVTMVAPDEPKFWAQIQASPEMADGLPDPVDRWSTRVLQQVAADLGGIALFPFGRAPFHPFYSWALRAGQAHVSPVTFLVDAQAGLFGSYRGALVLPTAPQNARAPTPCDSCAAQPCATACPVGALTPQGYDVAACHAYLDTPAGADCLTAGCRVRRACPVGATRRLPAQSAYHMRLFHR